MYFKKFPKIKYDFTIRTDSIQHIDVLQDLTTKISLFIESDNMDELCFRYTVKNGELPEHVAFKFYQNPQLAWTIMYINKIGDLNSGWAMSDLDVIAYTKSKYGVSNLSKVHHCEKLPEKIWMDKNFIIDNYGIDALEEVTNIDHEAFINDQKRYIHVIKPEYLGRFISLFESKLK